MGNESEMARPIALIAELRKDLKIAQGTVSKLDRRLSCVLLPGTPEMQLQTPKTMDDASEAGSLLMDDLRILQQHISDISSYIAKIVQRLDL